MSGLARVVRGLLHRPGSTAVMLIVAVVASAAAATAPTYYTSARTSILRDTLASAPLVQRGFEVTEQGVVTGGLTPLVNATDAALRRELPDSKQRARLFAPPIQAIEATARFATLNESPVLAWRSDVCAHLRLVDGGCPQTLDQVMISQPLAQANGWKVGDRLAPLGWPALTVTGVYAVPDYGLDYWFGRGARYFPMEDTTPSFTAPPPADAMFAVRDTLDKAPGTPQGIMVIDTLVDRDAVRGSDLDALAGAIGALPSSEELAFYGGEVETGLPGMVSDIHDSWRSLAVTEFLVAVQLLVLVWLLMFLVVKDAVEARGPEIALLKLRGYAGFRILRFGLGEPVFLLAVALPLGVLLGWGITAGLAGAQLRSGVPITLPALAWAAAGAATLGGLAAVTAAGRRTLRRSVVDQWRRVERHGTRRGWVVDAIVVTGAVAGLVELSVSGQITSVGHGSLGLLEPGLLGLAVAVVASRALPLACRALFGVTGRRGSLGMFLAARQLARGPGGMRTAITLGMAFALATFGVAAWTTGQSNREMVAQVSLGAPTVLTVVPPQSGDLATTVDQLDPSGTQAAVVESYYNGGAELLAVDPDRFARVAAWRDRFASAPLSDLAKTLRPDTAPPVNLDGDQFRVRLDVESLKPVGEIVVADVSSPGTLPVQVDLGSIDQASGPITLTARLLGCPCQLQDLIIQPAATPGAGAASTVKGAVVVEGIDVHGTSGWTTLPGVTAPAQWSDGSGGLASASGGVRWPFQFPDVGVATLRVNDYPQTLPAIVSSSLVNGGSRNPVETLGLDGRSMKVQPVATASAIPGATTAAVVVDRVFAERAAGLYVSSTVTRQVWTTTAAAPRIEAGLRKAGVHIDTIQTAGVLARSFDRQGPGLGNVSFLANAIAAVVIAAAAAVAGLVATGRRRRYEHASLMSTGASRRTLFAGVLAEQAGVLVSGAIAGIVAGLAAVAIALRGVPEFVNPPNTPLSYTPSAGVLGAALGGAVVVLLAIAAVASWALVRGVRSDQLREGAA